jgi:hypothetical protein
VLLDALHESGNATRSRNALCSVVVTPAIGVVAVAALVVLAGCLAGYAETMGYVRPADAQLHRMIDQGRQLGVEFLLVQPRSGDPF